MTGRSERVSTGCKPAPSWKTRASSLSAIVATYIRERRSDARREFDFYRGLPSFKEAVAKAALSVTACGKRHSHQRRLNAAALKTAMKELLGSLRTIRRCTTFEDLLRVVETRLGPVAGIGALAEYDIATRIGARLNVYPGEVYLHRGTRDGAVALGFSRNRRSIAVRELPREFCRLEPYEIEDCLCIFKDELGHLKTMLPVRRLSLGCGNPRRR